MRETSLNNLAKKIGFGANANKETIDWNRSAGSFVSFVYDDIVGVIEILEYDMNTQKILIKYNDIQHSILTSDFIKCNLASIIGLRNTRPIYNIGYEFGRFEIIKITKTNKNRRSYVSKCKTCGLTREIVEKKVTKNALCMCCDENKVVVAGVNDIATTHPDYVKYFKNKDDANKYMAGSHSKTLMVCPVCGEEKSIMISNLINQGLACKKCSDGISYPNKFMYNVLKQIGITFEAEYPPEWAIDENGSQRRYDFYIPSKNLIIEMDGGLGHGVRVHSKSTVTLEKTIEFDDIKDELATKHGLKIIRVDCFKSDLEYIRNNILNSELISMFDFKNIDWNSVNSNSSKSIVKDVCLLWDSGKYVTTEELSKFIGISKQTVIRYLKRGVEIGWCKYNPKDEILKAQNIASKSRKKKVAMFTKNGDIIGVFSSPTDLAKISENEFGVELLWSKISAVCLGRRKSHKGFTFKYVED